MNIKQLFLPLVGALALISCNKEAVEPHSVTHADSKATTIALSIEATADASEMRAVSFDAKQDVPPTIHEEGISDWITHCFLRKDDGSKRAYAVITWDARVEGGKVKLKMRGHTLELKSMGSANEALDEANRPVAGERWLITGITGGGEVQENRTRVVFNSTAAYDGLNANQAQVPFTFEPQGFTVAAESGVRAPQISVHFKPQGSLLKVYIDNKKNYVQYAVATDLQVTTNALSNNGYYDYSTGEAKWHFNNAAVQEEVLSRPVAIAANSAKHYVLWAMPRPATAEPTTGFKSSVKLDRCITYGEGTTSEPALREGAFESGAGYSMGVEVGQSWSPLNAITTTGAPNYYVKFISSKANKFIDPTTFESDVEAYNSGIYYLYTEAVNHFGILTTENHSDYYLPTVWELGTIFPGQKQGQSTYHHLGYSGTTASGAPVVEIVQFKSGEGVDKQANVTSYYNKAPKNIIYALRFCDLNGTSGNNEKRTAFRYQWVKIRDLGDGKTLHGLKITTRYLGNTGDDNNYRTEEYWTDSSKNAQDVTVTIPDLGRAGHKSDYFGHSGLYWSSTPNEVTPEKHSHSVGFSSTSIHGFFNYEKRYAFPLILFPKN